MRSLNSAMLRDGLGCFGLLADCARPVTSVAAAVAKTSVSKASFLTFGSFSHWYLGSL